MENVQYRNQAHLMSYSIEVGNLSYIHLIFKISTTDDTRVNILYQVYYDMRYFLTREDIKEALDGWVTLEKNEWR